ncbi:MAG: MarC family protein [Saprospiraceae bacterium]|nr:MarC family protein [Saprospiraceae bacterium]
MNFDHLLTVSFTLFAIIDMLGNIPVLISLREKIGGIEAWKAALASGFLMITFLFVGEKFLGVLGVDLPSFALAGSILIFIMGLEMTLGIDIFKADGGATGSIVPVAFPLVAGSGTLTTVMSLKTEFDDWVICVGILLNVLFIYIVIRLLNPIEKLLGKGGLLVVRKFMGVILLAIAVKIFKSNLK